MRSVSFLILAFVLGAGIAFFLLRDGDTHLAEPGPVDETETELARNPHVLMKTGTLVVRARAPDGSVPAGTEVGYRFAGETRLVYAAGDGTREFADAPLGDLVVIARAPGYAEATQPRRLLAGVAMEVILHLVPAAE